MLFLKLLFFPSNMKHHIKTIFFSICSLLLLLNLNNMKNVLFKKKFPIYRSKFSFITQVQECFNFRYSVNSPKFSRIVADNSFQLLISNKIIYFFNISNIIKNRVVGENCLLVQQVALDHFLDLNPQLVAPGQRTTRARMSQVTRIPKTCPVA